MKQYTAIVVLMILIGLSSCNAIIEPNKGTVEKTNVEIEYLNGYFPRNDIFFETETMHIIITNRDDFDNYFGIAKTMNNIISEIDFNENHVVGILTKPSDEPMVVSIQNAVANKHILTVYYKTVTMEKQSFTSSDIKIFQIPKTINSVHFSSEKGMIKIDK